MKRRAWLALLLIGSPVLGEETFSQTVQKQYIDPILDQIGNAAHAAADPNGMARPPMPMPGYDAMSPHARLAVDYARTKLIDPLTEATSNSALQAARVLGSSDPNASAPGLEDHIFDFPNQMAGQIAQMIHEIMNSHEALSAPAGPLPGETLPPNLRKRMTPVAAPKDFAYRKDSVGLVRGAGLRIQYRQKGESKLNPIKPEASPTNEKPPSKSLDGRGFGEGF